MLIRRIILGLMLTALGVCALAGVIGLFASEWERVWPILGSAFLTAIALGLMLPLTLLAERTRYRAAGFAAMLTIGFLACFVGATMMLDTHGHWSRRELLWMGIVVSLVFGVPATGGLLLVQFKWARFAAWALAIGSGVAMSLYVIGVFVAIVLPGGKGEEIAGTAVLTFLFSFLTALLLVNSGCGDWRYFRAPAIVFAWLDFFLFLTTIWWINAWGARQEWVRWGMALLFGVIFLALLNLLLMANVQGIGRIVRGATIACALMACALIAGGLYLDVELISAMGIAPGLLAATGAIAVVILALLRRRYSRELGNLADSTILTDIEFFCPRCKKRQTLPLGDSACVGCGLKLILKAIEPRCIQCGYLLYGTASNRCSECGAVQTEPAPVGGGPEGGIRPAGGVA